MKFDSADPSVIRSVKQRDLLNAWLRGFGKLRTLPALRDYQPDRVADELTDMIRFDVAGEADSARFLITHVGARLTTTYGHGHIDPDKRTNHYLDDAIGRDRYARVVGPYRVCVTQKRPTYSVSMVQDLDGKDVSYERLLLPFGTADAVEQIVGSYKSISIEGGFKINNLMGIAPKTAPVSVINTVIDLDFACGRASPQASDDVIELS